MNAEQAYLVWAPEQGPWSPWTKPVLFASEPIWDDPAAEPGQEPGVPPTPAWVSALGASTAFVIDLPGAESVRWGIALARSGWRPVPLYNAVPGPSPLVDVASIVHAMRRATPVLEALALPHERPPVFLLDSLRRHGSGGPARPGMFDNRSLSLPTDFPSALFLRARGIERVVLVQEAIAAPQADLAHTLVAWQEAGLSILTKAVSAEGTPEPIRVQPPSNLRVMWYRFLATLGMRRSPLGGFGGRIPVPSAG